MTAPHRIDSTAPALLGAAALESFVRNIFVTASCDAVEVGRITTHLVGANLAGHDSHGVVRVP